MLLAVLGGYYLLMLRSSWQATLGMRLLRLRLVSAEGTTPRWPVLLLRAALALMMGYILIAPSLEPFHDYRALVGGLGVVLVVMTLLHPRQQAPYDLPFGTLVVRTSVPLDAQGVAQLPRLPALLQSWRGRLRWLGNGLVVVLMVLGLQGILLTAQDRNLISRTHYALVKVEPLQRQVEAFYADHGRLPEGDEAPAGERINFPDGGGAELLAQGEIRIWFAHKPQLKQGEIRLRLDTREGTQQWVCEASASLQRWVPGACREAR